MTIFLKIRENARFTCMVVVTTKGNIQIQILPPKMQPSPKNLAVPVTGPISFEAEKYFNDLSPNKKFVKVCNSQIFSKKIKIFALNFIFHCRQLIF